MDCKRLILFSALLFVFMPSRAAGRDSLLVMFWNVENYFSYRDTSAMQGKGWSAKRFYAKGNGICKTIFKVAQQEGRLPDVVAFAEIGDSFVLRQLLKETLLRKIDYSPVHYESPDRRGIDCALIYRRSILSLKDSSPKHLYGPQGEVIPTRDILLAGFDSLDILVNHHPSKVGDNSGSGRTIAMDRMNFLCDSLLEASHRRILCIGDFNDALWEADPVGTIKYNGKWEKIDGCFPRGDLDVSERVFADPSLSIKDTKYGGIKPGRTYVGPRYRGGISDHYPILVWIFF